MANHTSTQASFENQPTWAGGRSPFNVSYGKLMMWIFLLSDAFTFSTLLVQYGTQRFSNVVTPITTKWPDPASIFNHFPFMHETPAKRLSLEMEQIYYNDSTYIADYAERVEDVTSATVADAVRKHWSVDNYLLVAVVSDGEQFKAELLDDQTVIEYPSGTTNTGLEAVDEQVKQFDLMLTEADIVIVKASELFK